MADIFDGETSYRPFLIVDLWPIIGMCSLTTWLLTPPAQAVRGCCSMHGGVSSCNENVDRLICGDGTYSPSCACQELESVSTAVPKAKEPVKIGKDILLKDSTVHVENLRPEVKDAFGTVTQIWKEHTLPTPMITSGNDGIHPDKDRPGTDCSTQALCRKTSGSRHYQDLAVDIRSKDISTTMEKKQVFKELQDVLETKGYWVGLDNPGTKDECYHIQYNPPKTKQRKVPVSRP